MFDESRGFFYLVFANPDDCFFTESYIKLDFPSYLYRRLLEDDFRHICFIGKTPIGRDFAYQMDFIGALGKELHNSLKKKKSFAWGLKKKKHAASDSETGFDSVEKGNRVHIDFDFPLMKDSLLKVIEMMDGTRDIAVVCPIEIFAECCEADAVLKKMIIRQSQANHNIMLLTSSVDAAENDRYFRNPQNVFQEKCDPLISDVFYHEKLFPNMSGKFNDSSSNTPKLVLTYDALKEAFAERMVVLNSLSYDRLRIAVRYALMRGKNTQFCCHPDTYAALIWAWYENSLFREKYPQLKLPENPFRSTKVITEHIAQHGMVPAASEVIAAEQVGTREFVNRWFCETGGAEIAYDRRALQGSGCYAILRVLGNFRRLIAGHESLIGDEEMKKLSRMIRYFSKPSYTSVYNHDVLPHERFNDAHTKQTLQNLFAFLHKDEWNNWDDGAVHLLYTLLELCYRHGTTISSMDYYNSLGKAQFEKGMQAIAYCMKNSQTNPADSSGASCFSAETVRVLRSGDLKKIKDYIILKGEGVAYG